MTLRPRLQATCEMVCRWSSQQLAFISTVHKLDLYALLRYYLHMDTLVDELVNIYGVNRIYAHGHLHSNESRELNHAAVRSVLEHRPRPFVKWVESVKIFYAKENKQLRLY